MLINIFLGHINEVPSVTGPVTEGAFCYVIGKILPMKASQSAVG
jgi:hypothetical protein